MAGGNPQAQHMQHYPVSVHYPMQFAVMVKLVFVEVEAA